MALRLHRCSTRWKAGPCWRVQKALDEQGIEYVVVKGPARASGRVELQRLSRQKLYPVIESENDSTYREESRRWPSRYEPESSTRSAATPPNPVCVLTALA